MRLGHALESLDGIEAANANLLGQLSLSWDDARVERAQIVAALESAGFRPVSAE